MERPRRPTAPRPRPAADRRAAATTARTPPRATTAPDRRAATRRSSVPDDVTILDPDSGNPDASDQCDLDGDGHLAMSDPCNGDDCCDFDGRAFPGGKGFFTTPDACGSYDYNCDGKSEEQQPGTSACKLGFFSCSGDGFASDTPCGVTADYVTCKWAGFSCSESKSPKTQACR